jgi:O-antigen/teichoic acid export membrane protein
VIFAALPLFVVMVPNAGEIMLVFGGDYVAKGAPVLLLLSFGQLVNCVTGGVGFTLTMTGRQKLQLANTGVLLLVSLVLHVLLIPRYGIAGAAIAQTAAICLVNIVGVLQIHALYDMLPYRVDILALLAPSALCLALIVAAKAWLGLHGPAALAGSAVLAAGVFSAYYLLFGINAEDRYLYGLVRSRLAGRAR